MDGLPFCFFLVVRPSRRLGADSSAIVGCVVTSLLLAEGPRWDLHPTSLVACLFSCPLVRPLLHLFGYFQGLCYLGERLFGSSSLPRALTLVAMTFLGYLTWWVYLIRCYIACFSHALSSSSVVVTWVGHSLEAHHFHGGPSLVASTTLDHSSDTSESEVGILERLHLMELSDRKV